MAAYYNVQISTKWSSKVKSQGTKGKPNYDFLSKVNSKCMSIWYHFEDISYSTVYLLSNLFNCHGLIKSKFNRLLRLTIPSLSKVRFDWRISMGRILGGGRNVHGWTSMGTNIL